VPKRIRPIGHEDRLSLVEHLDELRTRIILSLAAFGVALGLCFWQNHLLLRIANHPLGHRHPVTLGVAEPFTTTLTIAAYAAILLAMPILLYELYAFVLPAFSPTEKKAALPLMRRQHSGHIINVASTAATRAWANASAYHASKWGLVGFSRGLGVEGRADGIRVTTIIPGGMRTHFFDRFTEQGIPMPEQQNLQDPATVARVIVFATQVPPESALQEVIITPMTETSWP